MNRTDTSKFTSSNNRGNNRKESTIPNRQDPGIILTTVTVIQATAIAVSWQMSKHFRICWPKFIPCAYKNINIT